MKQHHNPPHYLSFIVVIGFFASLFYLLHFKVDLSGDQGLLIGSLFGYASAKADLVLSYYYGSSVGSRLKDYRNLDEKEHDT